MSGSSSRKQEQACGHKPPGDQPQNWRATGPRNGGHQPKNWTGEPLRFNHDVGGRVLEVSRLSCTSTCRRSVCLPALHLVGGRGSACGTTAQRTFTWWVCTVSGTVVQGVLYALHFLDWTSCVLHGPGLCFYCWHWASTTGFPQVVFFASECRKTLCVHELPSKSL